MQTELFQITHVTRDKPQLGKELGDMSPAQRDTNAALCRCVINWPYIHQDIPTGPLNSLTARTIRPTTTSSSSMAFAGDTIHSRIRRVCDKITVIAVENFTSFHVDDACPPHILSHIHTLARINPHTFVRECTSRLPHDGTEDTGRTKSNGKNGKTTAETIERRRG